MHEEQKRNSTAHPFFSGKERKERREEEKLKRTARESHDSYRKQENLRASSWAQGVHGRVSRGEPAVNTMCALPAAAVAPDSPFGADFSC